VRGLPVAAGVFAILCCGTEVHGQDVGYTASLSVARAGYPTTERLTGIYLFNSVDIATGPLRASVSIPFIRQRVTSSVPLTDPLTGIAAVVDDTNTGFGDPLIRVDVRVFDGRGLQVGVAGSVKPAIVNAADGLGTGAVDYGVGGSVFQVTGRTSLFLDLLYWNYGDPEGTVFQDSLSYSAGVGRILGSGRWSALLSLAGFSRGVDDSTPPLQLNMGLLALAGRRQSLAITAGVGLTDSAGDFSLGTSWRITR
jgi:hypothetical protein